MKKLSAVAVAVCLFVGSAFASWDYFPPKEAGKGEAKLSFEYGMPMEKVSTMDLTVGARYSIIEGLEAALYLPVPLSYDNDGKSADDYVGLSLPAIGVRYWLPMGLGFFLDFTLPVDTRENSEYWVAMELGVGAQYSTKFTEELSFGSELGLIVPFENDKTKFAYGMDLKLGVELDYSLGMVTPYLGVDAAFGITNASDDGNEIKDSAADPGIDLKVGAGFSFTEALGASIDLKFGFGDRYGDDMPISIGASFSYNF